MASESGQSFRRRIGLTLVPSSPLPIGFTTFVLRQRVPFALWFHARRLWLWLRRYPFAAVSETSTDEFIAENSLPYNREMMWTINRARTERLMNVLRSVNGLSARSAQMLCIGPRNEAEILLLTLHGFSRANITAIDLFSYSPLIRVMDMHRIQYPDNSFDVVYSCYVITYSPNIDQACAEALRVCRPGGVVVFAFMRHASGLVNRFGANPLEGGTAQLLDCFSGAVDSVVWREEFEREPGQFMCSVIFRVKKPEQAAPQHS